LCYCINNNKLQMYLRLERKQEYKRDARVNAKLAWTVREYCSPIYRHESHPMRITTRPFAFGNNSIVIYLGLDSLFLFKSVSSFLPSCRSSLAHSFGSVPSFVLFPCFFIPWVLVRRSMSTHYTPEALLNHVFEDLRKPKAPNRLFPEYLSVRTLLFLVLECYTSRTGQHDY
jgi:hypothetical protein